MPTFNINGNIRTNTAAGWAADNTVYSAKTILVTTDVFWPGTDQHKFKFADGVQTWSNLQYPFTGLDQVLQLSQSTGGNAINGPDGSALLRLNNLIAELVWDDGSVLGGFSVDDVDALIDHDLLINLNAPSVKKNGAEIATEAYADTKGFPMQGAATSVNPADNATHSFADANIGTASTYITTVRIYVPKACTLKRAKVFVRVDGVLGSAETGTFNVVKNGVTDIVVSSSVQWNVGQALVNNNSLNTSFADGDWFNFKVQYPAFATNPTTVSYTVALWFE